MKLPMNLKKLLQLYQDRRFLRENLFLLFF